MGCGGSTEAAGDKDKEKETDAKAKADAAAAAKAKADADAAAKAKADADAAAAAPKEKPKSSGKPGTPGGTPRSPGTPRSSTSKPADHEANSSRNAPLIASRPNVDLNAAVDVEKARTAAQRARAAEGGADGQCCLRVLLRRPPARWRAPGRRSGCARLLGCGAALPGAPVCVAARALPPPVSRQNPLQALTTLYPTPPQLKAKFKAFAEFGDGPSAAGDASPADGAPPPPPVRIDGFRFAKLCRDAGLVDGKKLPLGGVDVAFEGALAIAAGKGLDTSGRKLDYDGFLIALELIAKALGVPLVHVQLWVSAAEPLEKATQALSLDASRPLEKPAEETEPLKPVITANKLFKRKG
jgi:hypothetical protein